MKTIVVVICCVLVFLFTGCYTPHFLPNTAPTPMFEEAGKVRVAGYAGTNSYDLHAAISPVNHIGFVGSSSWSFRKKVDSEDNNKLPEGEAEFTHGHRYYEGALLLYLSPFILKTDRMKIEMLVGYGKGTSNASLDSGKKVFLGVIPITQVDAKSEQYYIQLNTAVSDKKMVISGGKSVEREFEYGSIFRYSKTRYSDFSRKGSTLGLPSQSGNYFQFGGFANIGGNGIGLTAQIGWLWRVSESEGPSLSPFFIAVGLNIKLW